MLYECDSTCCICEKPTLRPEIHHIDNNRANTVPDNLVVLCRNCHAEFTLDDGCNKLTPEQIKEKKEDLVKRIADRRKFNISNTHKNPEQELLLESLAIMEVRKIRYGLIEREKEWEGVEEKLGILSHYGHNYGFNVKNEVLYVLSFLTGQTALDMPSSVAHGIWTTALGSLPIRSLVHKDRRGLTKNELSLLEEVCELGFEVTYDGIKRLHDIKVVEAGSHMLGDMLRYAVLNNHKDLQKVAEERFKDVVETAEEDFGWKFPEAAELLKKEILYSKSR